MKNHFFIIVTLVLSISFSACNKKDDKDPVPAPAPAKQMFIKFTLDGTAKNITGTTASINTGFGGGAYTSSGFFNFNDNIHITLSMDQENILGADLEALVGQKILVGSCGGCPTNIQLIYDINGDEYRSSDSDNKLPDEYIKFNSVTFDKEVTIFDKKKNQYYVTGEFNLKLSSGSDVKNATGGTFGIIFQESKL
ncbi:MAG: hypothetical protein EOP53_18515 [Sphingobacteriales bacterium]|nr:MAG: hypothetical protein EOP53_18515 [Sphingobacteriales bacterium]